jgi:hypothetical protein
MSETATVARTWASLKLIVFLLRLERLLAG